MPLIELCGKNAYKILIPKKAFLEYENLVERLSLICKIIVRTKHLTIGEFEGSKVSISRNSIIIRECDEEKAIRFAETIMKF
jgi:hypothetical protein